jgi:gliding motility-associated-like protein
MIRNMSATIKLCLIAFLLIHSEYQAQVLSGSGALVYTATGAILHINGGVRLENVSTLTNNGNLTVTKNSSLPEPGNFHFLSNTLVDGNGTYRVEQDWINDATFTGGNSTVILYGNTQQLITSNNGTSTEFNNLTLSGTGTGLNRRKSLQLVDASTSTNGVLSLNDRELHTNVNSFFVENTNANAVLQNTAFGNEGFVSSLTPGFLYRNTNAASSYLYPVGSSDGTLRYRPVTIVPENNSLNEYAVRFNNYNPNNDTYLLSQKEAEIEEANALFYHSMEHASGNTNGTIRIHYLPASDGSWSGIANWSPSQNLWTNTGETTLDNIANYSFVEKAIWAFNNKYHPYLLINIGDELIIPNVFTPNGDGSNDIYFVSSKGLTEFNMTIVNRWGNVVFESNDSQIGWDGTSNGMKCSDGVYFYILNAKSQTKEYKKHGHITLSGN